MNMRKAILVALTSFYAILWMGGIGSHFWYGRTPDGALWAAPLFLLLAGVLVLLTADRTERFVLLAVAALGFAAEVIGVHFGVPFGRYEYTDVLQPQMLRVPIVMAAAWVVLIAYVRAMLTRFQLPSWLATLIGSGWMTAIDLVIDPLAAGGLNYWRWSEHGAYYGIPLQNFFGWFVVSWLIFLLLQFVPPSAEQPSPGATVIGLSILLFFTLIALAQHAGLIVGIGSALCFVHLAIMQSRARRLVHRSEQEKFSAAPVPTTNPLSERHTS